LRVGDDRGTVDGLAMIDLQGSPYVIEGAGADNLGNDLRELQQRVELLRSVGKLTPETLERYYGQKRFEQIAESNAIEGSTLSVGETELAVLKGITLTGHDPRFVNAARNLDRALQRLRDLARESAPTDVPQVKEIHTLVLGEGPGAGSFRREEVRISGSRHRPPRTWSEVMSAMEVWERWSQGNPTISPVLRSAVLHAWLVHIHPFIDGNGRTARAIGNLELIRAGYPPIIIKKVKHRDRYVDALAESDEGNLASFVDLILARCGDAIRDLERAAAEAQGYDAVTLSIRRKQQGHLDVWNAAVDLLLTLLAQDLNARLETVNGTVEIEKYRDSLDLDDFIWLCGRQTLRDAWSFRLRCSVPGLAPIERLAWFGYRSDAMNKALPSAAAATPAIFWSERNPQRYPPWRRIRDGAPGGDEITLVGDAWYVLAKGRSSRLTHSELAQRIAADIVDSLQ
jgi:Fic family protein